MEIILGQSIFLRFSDGVSATNHNFGQKLWTGGVNLISIIV